MLEQTEKNKKEATVGPFKKNNFNSDERTGLLLSPQSHFTNIIPACNGHNSYVSNSTYWSRYDYSSGLPSNLHCMQCWKIKEDPLVYQR